MPEKSPDWITIFWFCLAAVSGGLGGCGAASIVGLRRSQILLGHFLAYMFIGASCGVLSYAFGHHFGHPGDAKSVMGWAMAVGFGVPLILAAHNFGARYAFKFLGIEAELKLRKRDDCDRGEPQ